MATSTIPTQHRALVLETPESGFQVKTIPTPQPIPGSANIRVTAAGVLPYHHDVYNGNRRSNTFPTPLVGGFGAIGHVAAVGVDAVALNPEAGRLVEDVKRRSRSPGADIETVLITGDEDKDADPLRAFGAADAVLDLTPAAAATSTHTKSAIKALRRGGRVSLMGSTTNFAVAQIMVHNITLKGKMMYERETIVDFVKMLERGLLPLGKDLMDTKDFSLEDWKTAFDVAAEHSGVGKCVVIAP
ncbi:hypothetical protein BJX65DRAFT_306146 [Aspergillus insuetus]